MLHVPPECDCCIEESGRSEHLPEDDYEDELIDAFDTQESKASAASERPSPTPRHESSNPGQLTHPSVQEFHAQAANIPMLYPAFDDTPKVPAIAAMVTSKLTQVRNAADAAIEKENIGEVRQRRVLPTDPVYREEELMSEEKMQRRRQQIEREMRVYQERFDHVAQALAGETPHQIEERKKRWEEQLERQEKRYEAMETRLQHQVERLEEREERRARIQTRHHRASRSLSPSSDREGGNKPEEVGA